ncbi:PREDICTED: beta-1,3-galactosyltransferase 2-like [Nanorana parkeri]|uniref:beta-1,3-galactosyltransferase 2-like n=1 Tax=Nanorana parkeri TaxID=125878 RepID=UPI0008547B78|nr:PREDICTED: beta-1,3-galactosyltransferase 2-like [Nanorana parkeri]
MLSLTRLSCSSSTKWSIIRILFLVLILFTLMVLLFSNFRWLPGQLVVTAVRIGNAVPELSTEFEAIKSEKKNEASLDKEHVLFPNALLETNTSKDAPKTLHIYDYLINEPDKCKDGAPFLILLIAAERWQKEARQAIRQTWGKEDFLPGVRILRLFFIGKDVGWNDDARRSLLEESQMFHDIIQQDYLDTYYNLTVKVMMGLSWISTHCPEASYVMKTDSDMFVNSEYLISRLLKPEEPPRPNYFTGYLMTNATPIRNLDSKWYVPPAEYPEKGYPLFCSGTGYVFSANLAPKIVQVSPTVKWIRLEDVFVGLCLDKLGVLPVAPPKPNDFNAWRVFYTDCEYNQIVTSHELRPGEIIYFWNKLQQNKHKCV